MYKRKVFSYIESLLKRKVIPILIGHRRVGKTTILEQIAAENDNCYIVDFDNPKIKIMDEIELFEFLEEKISNGVKYLLLDEVQQLSFWDSIVKKLHDYYVSKDKVKIVVTGSSSLSFRKKDTGVDRTEIVYIGTLSFSEYIEMTGLEKSFENFEDFLINGGFPFYSLNKINWDIQRRNILWPMLSNDIPKEYGMRTNNIEKLIVEISKNSNGEFNKMQYCQRVSITMNQIEEYLDILEQSMIIKKVYKLDENGDFTRFSRFKVYINPHFHLWLLEREFNAIDDKAKGHIIESYWVFSTIAREGYYSKFYYMKNGDGEEIDFVFPEHADKVFKFKKIIEFKYSDHQSSKHFKLLTQTKAREKIVFCKENRDKNDFSITFKNIIDEF